jgi:6-phosphogluconate dehydrogenase
MEKKHEEKADIGMIGLAVMGENLALNMESKGFTVAVYNRTVPGVEEGVVDRFINGRGQGKNFIGSNTIEDFVKSLAAPRRIMMMVKAGKPVDELIEQLLPLIEKGDILIDGGNSHFPDTIRRTRIWNRRESSLSAPASPAEKRARCAARPSCRAVRRKPGLTSDRFSRRSPPRYRTARPAATGSEKTAPDIL